MNKKCQVFTPPKIVTELLDIVGYHSDLVGKKIIENACGDGNILKAIVDRYITDCIQKGINLSEIKLGLQEDIYGAEIDKNHYLNCIGNLDAVAKQYGIVGVNWSILNVDILKEDIGVKFDFVVGNPPYITYKELDEETRNFVREKFLVCKEGKFDYCYAFIESSIKLLSEHGKMSYLIPNSIFKNVFAQNLRDYLLPLLKEIYDYKTIKLFDVLTSSAIIYCEKARFSSSIYYRDLAKRKAFTIDKTNLHGKWEFTKKYKEKKSNQLVRFGDHFNASNTIATLYNKAFILNSYRKIGSESKHIQVDNYLIEKELVKTAVSPKSLHYQKNELIIFPYYYIDGLLNRYSTNEFESKFPMATEYLRSFRTELGERNSDSSVEWFEYGRTQALSHIYQEKLLLSTVVTSHVKVYKLPESYIPYAGIFITSKSGQSLDLAKKILESNEFLAYVKRIGTNASGSSLRITTKDIKNFKFPIKGDASFGKIEI